MNALRHCNKKETMGTATKMKLSIQTDEDPRMRDRPTLVEERA